MTVIDTLDFAEQLARDGVFTREQAERLARLSGRAVTEALATKEDIATIRSDITALRGDIATFKSEVASEFARTRTDLEQAIARTRAELDQAISQTRAELDHSILANRRELDVQIQLVNKETIKWITGILLTHGIAVIGVTVALIRLL